MPKTPASPASRQERRHNPLAEDVAPTEFKQKASKRKRGKSGEDDQEQFVDSKASRRILAIGQELADEDEQDRKASSGAPAKNAFSFESRFEIGQDDNEVAEEDGEGYGDEEAWADEEEEEVEEIEVDPNDLDVFNRFNPSFDDPILRPGEDAPETRQVNLGDLLEAKLREHEDRTGGQAGPGEEEQPVFDVESNPKLIEVYTKVGIFLSRYKSGALPKPFKMLTTLPFEMIESLLGITRPEMWTPNAMFAATRIFVSGGPRIAQFFISEILLDRVRDDIAETRKLNVHLFQSLVKALYRPGAFFKGFLFPLVGSGTCTGREAHIISSVLVRIKIPVLHSAAALNHLCQLAAEQMSGNTEAAVAANIFIKVLVEKKYALPYRVVDSLVFHFLRFRGAEYGEPGYGNDGDLDMDGKRGQGQKLPVIWHQALLAFAQRYKDDITEDQREALLDLLLVRGHKQIGPEVRRELLAGRGRGNIAPPVGGIGDGGDDTMAVDII